MATNLAEKSLIASMKARMPAVLVGPPGVGKTAKMYEIAEKLGYDLITLIGSQLDPTDIVGLPKGEILGKTPDGKDIHGTVNLAPWWQVRIHNEKKIILFLDEMSNTAGATRASMLTMLQNREFPNGLKMPAETIVVGAMNPAEQAADGYDLDMPTTNRINFIVWSPSMAEWTTGMLKAWGKDVSNSELAWRDKIVRFIESNPGELQKPPSMVSSPEAYGVNPHDPSEMEVLRYAWASRRSWDNLARVLPYETDPAVQDTLAQGMVGYAAAAKFRDWLKRNSDITLNDLLEDPTIMDWRTASPDLANQLLRAVVDVSSQEELSSQAIAVFEVLAQQGQTGIGAPFIRELLTNASSKNFKKSIAEGNRKRLILLAGAFKKVSDSMR